jgi:hypothetical protein
MLQVSRTWIQAICRQVLPRNERSAYLSGTGTEGQQESSQLNPQGNAIPGETLCKLTHHYLTLTGPAFTPPACQNAIDPPPVMLVHDQCNRRIKPDSYGIVSRSATAYFAVLRINVTQSMHRSPPA